MPFEDYSELSDREILIDIAGEQENIKEKVDNISEAQTSIQQRLNEDIEKRLARAEQVTGPLNEVKNWSGRALLLAFLVAIGTAMLAAKQEIRHVFKAILRFAK